MLREENRYFYGADQKTMVVQVYRDSVDAYGNPRDPYGTYEELCYDALGRRVLKRSRTDSLRTRTSWCYGAIERYVWDCSQLLCELRHNGADGAPHGSLTALLFIPQHFERILPRDSACREVARRHACAEQESNRRTE